MKTIYIILSLLSVALLHWNGHAQSLIEASRQEITLADGYTIVVLHSAERPHDYFYLPKTWTLSKRNGLPEIALTFYSRGSDEISGGILHVLIQWGLTSDQEKSVQEFLRSETDSLAVLVGAPGITLSAEPVFRIIPGHPLSDIFIRAAHQPVRVSTLAQHKTAIAFQLSSEDAKAIREFMANAKGAIGATYQSRYTYNTIPPRGKIKIVQPKEEVIEGTFASWISALQQHDLVNLVKL